MPVITPSGASGSADVLVTASVTLTNAQIKALPNTPVTLVAAPAARSVLIPVNCIMALDARGGAYTNIASLAVSLQYNSPFASFEYVEAGQGAFADASAVHVLGFFAPSTTGTTAAGWAAELLPAQPLAVGAQNGGNGALTGGNAANTLTVSVLYAVVSF